MTQQGTDVAELVTRLRGLCIDWNGQPMHPREEPRSIPDCGELCEVADTIERLTARIAELEAEREEALNLKRQIKAQLADLTNNTVQSKEAGDD